MTALEIFLVRHGETEWSRTGKHTGRTDVPLTDAGRTAARALVLPKSPARVLASPLKRAFETCALAGYDGEKTDALLEWNYGDYEGKTSAEIRASVPGWTVFSHGCPNGESGADVAQRVDPLIAEIAKLSGEVLLFAHGHVLRALTARWLGLDTSGGRYFVLETAHVSVLGFERETRVIRRWNAPAH